VGGLKEVIGRVSWTCAREPNGFTAGVEVDFRPPGQQRWIALGGASTGNPGAAHRTHSISLPVTNRPGQYRTKGRIQVEGQRRSKTSQVVTLS
jgi:hypothetical protein